MRRLFDDPDVGFLARAYFLHELHFGDTELPLVEAWLRRELGDVRAGLAKETTPEAFEYLAALQLNFPNHPATARLLREFPDEIRLVQSANPRIVQQNTVSLTDAACLAGVGRPLRPFQM